MDIAGLKVMIIDDSNTIRRSAEIFLVQAGCQVLVAEDGFDALAKISDHLPDVIFCDIMMPRLDGYQTCSLIKKNQRFRSTPVIMLSAADERGAELTLNAFEYGGWGVKTYLDIQI